MISSRRTTSADARIGARIRMQRMAIRMSQSTLGEILAVSFQQVQKYERGTNRVSASSLVKVAKALNTTTDALLGNAPGNGAPAIPDAAVAFLGDHDGAAIARAFQRLPAGEFRRALAASVVRMANSYPAQAAE